MNATDAMASPLELFSDPDKLQRLGFNGAGIGVIAGIELPPSLVWLKPVCIAGIVIANALSSRWKEQAVAHAEAAKTSALANTTDEEVKAAIQAAVDAELQRRAALAVPPPAVTPVAR